MEQIGAFIKTIQTTKGMNAQPLIWTLDVPWFCPFLSDVPQ